MKVSKADWDKYILKLETLNETAAQKIKSYIERHGIDDTDALIDYAYAIVNKYGEGAAALAAQMYDEMAALEKKAVKPAEVAEVASYGDVAKSVNGVLKTSENPEEIAGAASRWVKMAGADTTLQNALRDGAEFAWVPEGEETCAFCIMLASNGWQRMSKRALKNGHAEHIHSNCNCQFAIRFNEFDGVAGYNPDAYKRIYANAEGRTVKDKLNFIRREQYAEEKGEEAPKWSSEKFENVLGKRYEEFHGLVNEADNRLLYDKFSETSNYQYMAARGRYTPGNDTVQFSYSDHPGMSAYSTLAHENGHMFDAKLGRVDGLRYSEVDKINERCVIGSGARKVITPMPSNSDEFLSALRADMEALSQKVTDRSIKTELLSTEITKNASAGVQDALDGFFSTQGTLLPWGHGDRYYNREYNRIFKGFGLERDLQTAYKELGMDASSLAKTKGLSRIYETASEAWANMSSAVTCGGAELEMMQQYMPNTYAAYLKIVEVVSG